MNNKLFMLLYDIDVNKGGITQVMLNRSKMFSAKGWDVDLITLDYKENYPDISARLRDVGRLGKDVNIINVYDYYRNKNTMSGMSEESIKYYRYASSSEEEGLDAHLDLESNNARYFENGLYRKYKKWTKNGVLQHIDYFNDNRARVLREKFAEEGNIISRIYFDLSTNKPKQELFYTLDGFCYLNRWYNDKEKISNIHLFNRHSSKVERFKNNQEFHTFWLNELCSAHKEKPFMICDGVGSASKVMDMDENLVNRIYAIHTNHFAKPHEFGSPIKDNHQPLLDNIDNVEAIVVLTEQQKEDIIKQFGDYQNIFVIPHFVSVKEKQVYKKDNLVTAVSRYHPEKGLDELINAFKLVVDEVPEASLKIYGDGPDRERLQRIIDDLALNDHVSLMGYSNSVDEVLGQATVSTLTSRFEGFSMVIIESLINRTPVVSYDVNYGPRDIIQNGKTGYVVPNKDRKEFASKVVKLLKAPIKANVMGQNGHSYAINKYNEEKHYDLWLQLFDNLISKEPQDE
ncbi:glycosyltransferase [Sediminibacillus massiliensis]|uniref:glycosyltransferase n=1 Tax=Sediminibacillus massiliensis TaxID=1926277 RepID=UPI00098879A7|nr:glycosyltransferase [Sediminibacillus massiliensis]